MKVTKIFLNVLRFIQSAEWKKYIATQFFLKYIAGCTACNTKFFLNVLRFVQPAMYLKKIVLRVVQPVMYLKRVLYCGLYNPQCKRCRKYNCGLYNSQYIYFLIVLRFV